MKKSSLLFCLLFIVLSFFVAQKTLAGVNDNVSGFAWSDSVGWVSFNCTDIPDCRYDYGVKVDPLTGLFSGYAWSENLGWIYFSPVGPYPDLPNYSACLDLPGSVQKCDSTGDYKVSGWAKILSNKGWVSLRGTAQDGSSYGVSWDNTNQELNGMAWSSDDLGWLSFNCNYDSTGQACADSLGYKVLARLDNDSPGVSVRGVPTNWQNADAEALISCDDGTSASASGCDTGSYKFMTYSSSGACSTNYSDYALSSPLTVSSHLWVCATAKDNAGNTGFLLSRVEFKVDKDSPSTAVISPDNQSWHNNDFNKDGVKDDQYFRVNIGDSDVPGGSGLGGTCKYIIQDFTSINDSTGEQDRNCGSYTLTASVDSAVADGVCSEDRTPPIGEATCKVSTKAFDLAGNDSGWQSRNFKIDYTPPTVGIPNLTTAPAEQGKTETFTAGLSDALGQISGCSFYEDNWGAPVSAIINISPVPCLNGASCTVTAGYRIPNNGEHQYRFACQDSAGNYTWSDKLITTASVNNPPVINSSPFFAASPCSSPTTQTNCNVNFSVSARDDDGDALSYAWNFGDTLSYSWHPGDESPYDPSHHYSAPGDYSVKVVISDGRGGEIESSPILVHVDEANLFVNLTANPNSGVYPLNGVDLTASVSGNMFGTINYKFDCTNDGVWDFQADSQTIETYTVTDLCNYSSAGTYTAKTFIERGIGGAENTVNISVKDNSPPEARISVTDYSSCGPGADASIAYTGCNFTLNNVSTDPNGQLDIKNSIWTIKNSAGESVHESTCNGLCDWTLISTISAGEYVAHLNVEDQSFAQSTVSKDFVVRQDIIADFKCSSDNVNWKACEDSTFRPLKGSRVYFLDQSEKSEGSTEIRTRTWTKDNAPFSSANDSNPSDIIQGTIIELTVEDGAGRIDSQSYNIQTQLSIPEWQEISPF